MIVRVPSDELTEELSEGLVALGGGAALEGEPGPDVAPRAAAADGAYLDESCRDAGGFDLVMADVLRRRGSPTPPRIRREWRTGLLTVQT